jgi:hypothetical protein
MVLFNLNILLTLSFAHLKYGHTILLFNYIAMIRKGITLLKKCFSTAAYSRAMYEAWKKNPQDVHEDWNAVFKNTPVVDTPVHSEGIEK